METILLVEDEAIIALAEKHTLEGFGYGVILARSGEAAVETVLRADAAIDLILMDIDLGRGIDGTEAARKILEERNLPIVFLTAHSEREQVLKVRGITRYGYVIKNSGDFVLQSSIEMAFELFRAHESLRNQEARLSTLLNTIPDLVWLKDTEGVYLACNPAFEDFFGASEKEIVGKTDAHFIGPELAEFFREKDLEAVAKGGPNANEEWITYASDGHRAYLETIKTPMFDGSGRLLGVLGIGRDITERSRMEEALKESERTVRRKLEALIEPEADLGELGLADIVDPEVLQSMLDDFAKLTRMAVAVLDVKGKILVAAGWHDVCMKFHRAVPGSAACCTESDLYLSAHVREGEYLEYRCRNGLWDIGTPLYIGPRHMGNIYAGQYFYEDDRIDEAFFEEQAGRYGYDRDAYLAAVTAVPRVNRETVRMLMTFLVRLTEFVSRLSFSNLSLARAVAERKRAEGLLSRAVDEKEALFKELQHRVKNSLDLVSSLLSLNMSDLEGGSRRVFMEAVDRIRSVGIIYDKLSESSGIGRVRLGGYLSDLVDLLRATYVAESGCIAFTTDIGDLECGLKRAVSLGLVLNELLTNAIKYAYRPGSGSRIRVSLGAVPAERDGQADGADGVDGAGDAIELRICDNGPGLPPGFDPAVSKSLGLRITSLLVEELEGELRLETPEDGHGLAAIVRLGRGVLAE
jgi:PAS domain S-box-containing protein